MELETGGQVLFTISKVFRCNVAIIQTVSAVIVDTTLFLEKCRLHQVYSCVWEEFKQNLGSCKLSVGTTASHGSNM